ncbi:MAG TPA: MoaD/ThiS family protein [Gemmataceae bacterium]|nr:MoaD/ThiS family protein [Gemmataceae bacterium]
MSVPITIELYGIARARAGRSEFAIQAATPHEALVRLAEACPSIGDVCQGDGRLAPQYLLSLDGRQFILNLTKPLHAGDRLLLLSADAGG